MQSTNNNIRRTTLGACASCGAYRLSCYDWCTPGKRFERGPSRFSRKNDPTSYAFWERNRIVFERRMMGDDL